MKTETATKQITQSGDSLVINVTKEVKRMGLTRGDNVNIILSSDKPDKDMFVNWVVDNVLSSYDLEIDDDTGAFISDEKTPYEIADQIAPAIPLDIYNPAINALDQMIGVKSANIELTVFRWIDNKTTIPIRSLYFITND